MTKKNFFKKFSKTLDKNKVICYNYNVNKNKSKKKRGMNYGKENDKERNVCTYRKGYGRQSVSG